MSAGPRENGWALVPTRVLRAGLDFYRRYVSPCLGRHCRFHPTCSRYALEALDQHGFVRGSGLAMARLLRCHPLHPGGFDPVPPPNTAPENRHVAD